MIEFNDCLRRQSIDPADVLIMRHRPPQPELRKRLPFLASERHDVFNAYQALQPKAENAMLKARYVASFIGQNAAQATFVGLYAIQSHRLLKNGELLKMPEYQEMAALGLQVTDEDCLDRRRFFDLAPLDGFARWSGRLICHWPPPERSWYRWADRNTLELAALDEDSRLAASMPRWDELVLTRPDLRALPISWQAALLQWRGIYLITDETDGQGYVGSAYGQDNIMGRWRTYASNGHGANVELRDRADHPLRFSILQRVSPDMDPADVIALEASWKRRLHTRDLGLNRN